MGHRLKEEIHRWVTASPQSRSPPRRAIAATSGCKQWPVDARVWLEEREYDIVLHDLLAHKNSPRSKPLDNRVCGVPYKERCTRAFTYK